MSEIKRRPHVSFDDNGDTSVTFDPEHTHFDILRYLNEDLSKSEMIAMIGMLDD